MRLVFASSALALMGFSSAAWAQDPAAAEALFREGRSLMSDGKTAAACEKFKASEALDASSGTLLNLAACHLALGKKATAWAEFLAAARLARAQQKSQQEAEASRRARELEPELSYLTIQVSDPVPGLEIRRGDELVQSGLYGTRVPVDPGDYAVDASAPGYQTLHLSASVGAARDQKTIVVPKLEANASASAVSAAQTAHTETNPTTGSTNDASLRPNPTPPQGHAAHTLPWVIGGLGAGFLVAGGVSGVLALSSNSTAKSKCPDPKNCNDESALSAARRRDTEATIANIGVGVGVVGVGVGIVLLLTSHAHAEENASWGVNGNVAADRGELGIWKRF